MPIYGSLKKDNSSITYDQVVGCLSNFEREQEGFIMEVCGVGKIRVERFFVNSFKHL